jgi:hypothetical protein
LNEEIPRLYFLLVRTSSGTAEPRLKQDEWPDFLKESPSSYEAEIQRLKVRMFYHALLFASSRLSLFHRQHFVFVNLFRFSEKLLLIRCVNFWYSLMTIGA